MTWDTFIARNFEGVVMRSLALGALSAVALLSAANAADIYPGSVGPVSLKDTPVPYVSWTGFYVGLNGGYAWTDNDQTIDYIPNPNPFFTLGNRGEAFQDSGAFGGGQLGYNQQYRRMVFGLEADIQASDVQDHFKQTTIGDNGGGQIVPAGLPVIGNQKIDYFGTVRGRIGYTFDNSLIYFTGGFAYGQVKTNITIFQNDTPAADKVSDQFQTGYVLGGGIEHQFNPNWSLKAEYQYIDLGDERLPGGPVLPGTTTNELNTSFSTVRVGLNYHIGHAYDPLN